MKKNAKKKAINSLRSEMSDMMGDKYSEGMKDKMSVKVVSDSKEGLEEGVSKAQEILKKRKSMLGEQPSSDISSAKKYGEKESSNYKEFEDEDDDSNDALKRRIKMLESRIKKK